MFHEPSDLKSNKLLIWMIFTQLGQGMTFIIGCYLSVKFMLPDYCNYGILVLSS